MKGLEKWLATEKASTTKLKMKLSDFDSMRRTTKERVGVLKAKVKAT